MKLARTLIVLLMAALVTALLGQAPTSRAEAAVPTPAVAVSPSTGLTRASVVSVKATGIQPSTQVQVIECDGIYNSSFYDCPRTLRDGPAPGFWTTTSNADGEVSIKVKLADPVFRGKGFGDPSALYCRMEVCRVFLVWDDAAGNQRVLTSNTLEFTGSPATVHVSPSRDLPAWKRVSVTGTAHGAEGRTIKVLQQACYDFAQGRGCYGQLPVKWGKVRADGTYRVTYPAQRYLGDARRTDCNGLATLGRCVISVIVLDSLGRHDDSFGVLAHGEPAAYVWFAGQHQYRDDVIYPNPWVKEASVSRGVVVRFRCQPTWEWDLSVYVSVAPQDPAYDPTNPVTVGIGRTDPLRCTGRVERLRLNLFALEGGDRFTPGQLVTVGGFTGDGPGGTGYTAPDVTVHLRR